MPNIDFFIENQLAVIPLPIRSKSPTLKGWTGRTFEDNDASEFSDNSNYGVVLGEASRGVVDIDLDAELARKLAPYFLPRTGWVFGHKSAPKSHYVYRVKGDAGGHRKFDVGGKFAEYRANGQMTVFPPSIHVSGEAIEFENIGAIGETTGEALLEALSLMTVCAVVHPHYSKGKRHDIVLALSGTLLAHNLSHANVTSIVGALCDVTGDEEKVARLVDVRTTFDRRDSDLPYTQKSDLIDLIGVEPVNSILYYLGKPVETEKAGRASTNNLVLHYEDFNDDGIAKLFARSVEDQILFDPRAKSFAVYSEGIWVEDLEDLKVESRLSLFIKKHIAGLRASTELSERDCSAQLKFALKYLDRGKAQAAIKQSRSFLSFDAQKFDSREDLVAVCNGVIDLREGLLQPSSPKHYITKRLEVEYDSSADCPRFKSVLAEAFGNDDELVAYFKGITGYWLTGSTNRQEIYFFHGAGANGKSTIINAIANVMGPYAGTMQSETLFDLLGNQNSYDLASLRGCRLSVAHEAESKDRLDASQVKRLTGGDVIKARQLYRDPIPFKPQFKIVMLCNKRPTIDAHDKALQRRIKLVPFEYVVPKEKRDATLEDKLKLEAPGILNFILEGARMHYRGEIREPRAVTLATNRYIYDQDTVSAFLTECTSQISVAKVGVTRLFEAYERHCSEEGILSLPKAEFRKVLIDMGFQDTRSSVERQWKGLRLRSDDQSGEQ